MPSSLSEQRQRLQRYIQALTTPGLTEKQRHARQKRLEEYAYQLAETLPHKSAGEYKRHELQEIRNICELLNESDALLFSQIRQVYRLVTARLQAYRELIGITKQLRALEYTFCQTQQIVNIMTFIKSVIDTYHKTVYDEQNMTTHHPSSSQPVTQPLELVTIRYAMSDTFQQELQHLYRQGRLDRLETLTAIFQAYFQHLESHGRQISINDVRQLITAILHDEGKTAAINTLFVEREVYAHDGTVHQERGIVDMVSIQIFEHGKGKITAYVDADTAMQHAVSDALFAATEYIRASINPDVRFEHFDYAWTIGSPNSPPGRPCPELVEGGQGRVPSSESRLQYKQTSIGLSIAIATIAAYIGRDIDPATALTGSVDRSGNIQSVIIEQKCAITDTSIRTLIVPEANRVDIPPLEMQRVITTVRTLKEAVEIIFGRHTLHEIRLSRYRPYLINLETAAKEFFNQISTELYHPEFYVARQQAEAQIDRFLQGSQTCFIITGDAGMGKTNLLYHLCQNYQAAGHLVFIEECNQFANFEAFVQHIVKTIDSAAHLEKILGVLDQLAEFTRKKVIFCLDALNEARQSEDWFRQVKTFVSTLAPYLHLKLLISCKTNAWEGIHAIVNQGKILPPERYQMLVLEEFSSDEFLQIKQCLNTEELPAICRYPFFIRMIHAVYTLQGRKIPTQIGITTLFREYLTARTQASHEILDLLQVMIAEFWERTMSQQDTVVDISYARLVELFEERLKGRVLDSFVQLFNEAKDQALLIERQTPDGLYVRFRFDWLVEYLLGQYLYADQCAKRPTVSTMLAYLRNKKRSALLEGAIKYIFLLAKTPDLFLEVAYALDDFDETLLVTALLWHHQDPEMVHVLLSRMLGLKASSFRANLRFSHFTSYMQVGRLLIFESFRQTKQVLRRLSGQTPPLRITEAHYSVPLFALKIASQIGSQGAEILLLATADQHQTEQFRQKAIDYLGNVYNQAPTVHQVFILEKTFAFARQQSDAQRLTRIIFFIIRCYMFSYKQPEISAKLSQLIAQLVHSFGKRPLVKVGKFAIRLLLDKVSDRESHIYDTFFQRADRGRLLEEFIRFIDDTAHPTQADIEGLERFIVEVSWSDIPERFVYFYFATRILFFCGVKDFTVVQPSLIRLYETLPYTTRDLVPGMIALIYRNHPTEAAFQLLEEVSWKLIEQDREYLIKGGHEENNMYYPLTPIGRATGERQGEQPAPIDFFVRALDMTIADQEWGLINQYLRELGTIGYNHPHSVLLTLAPVIEQIGNPATKEMLIRSLAAINMRFPDLITRFLQENLDDQHPYTPEIRRGVLTYEDDGTLQRVMDSSILYDFFTLMFVRSQAIRSFIIEVGSRVNDFDKFDDLIEYGLSRAIDLLTNA